jgi:hypothetical protein
MELSLSLSLSLLFNSLQNPNLTCSSSRKEKTNNGFSGLNTQISHAPPLSSRKEKTTPHKGMDTLVSTTLKSHMHLLLFKKRKEPHTTQPNPTNTRSSEL